MGNDQAGGIHGPNQVRFEHPTMRRELALLEPGEQCSPGIVYQTSMRHQRLKVSWRNRVARDDKKN
jgi:hypothetical protein